MILLIVKRCYYKSCRQTFPTESKNDSLCWISDIVNRGEDSRRSSNLGLWEITLDLELLQNLQIVQELRRFGFSKR